MIIPKYLARPSDGSILKRNENGTYSFMNSKSYKPNEHELESLLNLDFEIVTEEDFARLKEKYDLYYEWLSWAGRSDGHGGSKGGSFEEFMDQKNKFGYTE